MLTSNLPDHGNLRAAQRAKDPVRDGVLGLSCTA
jgi:hypothetical protein